MPASSAAIPASAFPAARLSTSPAHGGGYFRCPENGAPVSSGNACVPRVPDVGCPVWVAEVCQQASEPLDVVVV